MSDALKYFIVLAVLGGASHTVYYQYQLSLPCATPVAYRIGEVDTRFGVASAEVRAAAERAAAIWNAAAGKQVLTYDPQGELPITLVYDERQQKAEAGVGLEAERAALEAARRALGNNPRRTNADVSAYNARVRAFNAKVASYNASAGDAFNQGEYVMKNGKARITIFEFTDAGQLERVLAHELGHAVGLEHNEDPESIMYALNESGGLSPSAADLANLSALCNLPK